MDRTTHIEHNEFVQRSDTPWTFFVRLDSQLYKSRHFQIHNILSKATTLQSFCNTKKCQFNIETILSKLGSCSSLCNDYDFFSTTRWLLLSNVKINQLIRIFSILRCDILTDPVENRDIYARNE